MKILAIILTGIVVLQWLRFIKDQFRVRRIGHQLSDSSEQKIPVFLPEMIKDLPAPVQKMLNYLIEPGTPLKTSATFSMHGSLLLGNQDQTKEFPVQCQQILNANKGFVWRIKSTRGWLRFSGSDGYIDDHCWSRMWLMMMWPLTPKNTGQDMTKSALGRWLAESIIWTPAALIGRTDVTWDALDDQTIRISFKHALLTHQMHITINDHGQPEKLVFLRWSNENEERIYQFQPFGAKLSEYQSVDGVMIATQIEAGNHFGEPAYIPFYQMKINQFAFL